MGVGDGRTNCTRVIVHVVEMYVGLGMEEVEMRRVIGRMSEAYSV